jgi:hypothetical protein
MYNPFKPETPGNAVYYRPPTAEEIRFGYGATHYREFSPEEHKDRNWFKSLDDNLRYYKPR